MVVMEELGRGIVLEPYARSRWSRPVCCGPARRGWPTRTEGHRRGQRDRRARIGARVALPPRPRRDDAEERGGGTWKLSGKKVVVPAGAHANAFMCGTRQQHCRRPGGIALFLVARSDAA
jgi:hypothetical protein